MWCPLKPPRRCAILPFVREGGYLLVADEDIKPLPVLTGKAGMPENAREKLQAAGRFAYPRWPDR